MSDPRTAESRLEASHDLLRRVKEVVESEAFLDRYIATLNPWERMAQSFLMQDIQKELSDV